MTKKRLAPRHVFAENLRRLIEANGTTAPRVAEKAGVDRKTVNNMLNARVNPDLDNVRAVAAVFGLTDWQLLRHDLETSLQAANVIEKLIDCYQAADEQGKKAIMGVAEMAGKYQTD